MNNRISAPAGTERIEKLLVPWARVRDGAEGQAADGKRKNGCTEKRSNARAVQGGSGSLEDEFAVASGTGDQRYPDVAGLATTSPAYLVAWQDGTGSAADIYAQEATVTTTTGARITGTTAAYAQEYPAVAYNGAEGEALVVWQHDDTGDGKQRDIHGRVVWGANDRRPELVIRQAWVDAPPCLCYDMRRRNVLIG